MSNLAPEISQHIWETKYRYTDHGKGERNIADTWQRVARALAAVERTDAPAWEQRFSRILKNFRFLPGGRIQASAGTERHATLFNCFVMGRIEDSVTGIFEALREAAVTMQQGGGIGLDFSTLRPRGTPAMKSGSTASGPVSFMGIWDATCATILSMGTRRGAMMATLRCDHPDIEAFVVAKRASDQLRRFNLSVQVTDAFVSAVRNDADWPLVFPASAFSGSGPSILRQWPGERQKVPCRVLRHVSARRLWDLILRSAYECAEPGVLFIDRINHANNLRYCETITATNPCGEVPLPAYGACDLGSLNLTRFVISPYTQQARFDFKTIAETTGIGVRLLDNVIDASRYPLPQQKKSAHTTRRIGLGITGLADALLMLGMTFGSRESLVLAADVMRCICHAAYRASIKIAQEKGSFPCFDLEKYLDAPFIRGLPPDIRQAIAAGGIRNSHLLAIAPTGTISLLAGNVSSGLEPIFAASYERKVLDAEGSARQFRLTDYAVRYWRDVLGKPGLPNGFVAANDLPIRAHLDMQAALQPSVDNSIAKTVNVPASCPFAEFSAIYDLAYDLGLKGCTTFRPNPGTNSVLSLQESGFEAPHCCTLEREAD